ncbi:Kinesin light chain 3 [Rhizophlyctis rosea]|nr:Kinesin light chain 3 [Rhizophlyctis rosea]
MHPWNNPITLTRAWCVFEMYASVHTKSRFDIALAPVELKHIRLALRKDPRIFQKTLETIRSEDSCATKEEDLGAIRQSIRDTVGFGVLDNLIRSLLVKWIVNRELLTDMEEAAVFYQQIGDYEVAEKIHLECLAKKESPPGRDDLDTLILKERLAEVHCAQKRYAKAESLVWDCFKGRDKLVGRDDPEITRSLRDLFNIYVLLRMGFDGSLDMAERKIDPDIEAEDTAQAEAPQKGFVRLVKLNWELEALYKRQLRYYNLQAASKTVRKSGGKISATSAAWWD